MIRAAQHVDSTDHSVTRDACRHHGIQRGYRIGRCLRKTAGGAVVAGRPLREGQDQHAVPGDALEDGGADRRRVDDPVPHQEQVLAAALAHQAGFIECNRLAVAVE